jgi:ATP-dependent DNA helicase RecG
MNRTTVQSSNILSIGYDESLFILEVEFHSGAIWQYKKLSQATFNELINASSIGGYFNLRIKKKYEETQIRW